MAASFWSALRPKQWPKNVLVFTAPAAAGVLDQGRELLLAVVVFVAFCVAASGGYLWNDVVDVEADRAHPTKRDRPIASGAFPIDAARVAGTAMVVIGVALTALTGRWQAVAVIAGYATLTLLYTFVLKHVAVIDVVVISSGFMLRAAAGAIAVNVPMSRWFVLCITFGSLLVVVGKRYAERREVGPDAGTRSTLETYTPEYLRILISVSLGGALISYCIWAFETSETSTLTGSNSDLPWYELTVVPMLIALFRYSLVLEQGLGSAPEEVILRDRVLQLAGLVWVIIFAMAVYAN